MYIILNILYPFMQTACRFAKQNLAIENCGKFVIQNRETLAKINRLRIP